MTTTISEMSDELKEYLNCNLLHTKVPIHDKNTNKIIYICKECTKKSLKNKNNIKPEI